MQKLNRLAVFISAPDQLSKVPSVLAKYNSGYDFFLTSDADISSVDYAVIPPFYVKFYNGDIVFLTLDDYLANRDEFVSNKIAVVSSAEELISKNIDPKKSNIYKVIEV